MEIKIRNVSPEVVVKIDSLADKKGISRNEYLKRLLENMSAMDKVSETESKYNLIIERLIKVLDYNTSVLNKFCDDNLYDISEIIEERRLVQNG